MSKNRVQKWKNVRRSHSFIHRRLKICQKNIWVQNPALGQIWLEIHQCNSFYGPKKQKPVLLAVGAHDAFSQIFKMANENLARGQNFVILVTFVGLKTIREIAMQKMA